MPRTIIGGAFISLDGVIQGPGGPTEDPTGGFPFSGWMAGVMEEATGNQVDTLLSPPYDLLLGRRTYDIFAAYWPYQSLDMPIAKAFAECRKYVLTSSAEPLDWQSSHRLADLDALAALKAQDGPNLVIQGSSTLCPQLLERGLLDRLVLMIAPVVLGQGKRLFGDGTPAGTFKLVEQRTGADGWVMCTYDVAGPVQIGSFGPNEPSPAEVERQRKIEQGTW